MKVIFEGVPKEIADFLTLAMPENRLVDKCTDKVCNEISKTMNCSLSSQESKKEFNEYEPQIKVSLDISGLDEAQEKADILAETLKEIQDLMSTGIK